MRVQSEVAQIIERISELIALYYCDLLSAEEKIELNKWKNESSVNMRIFMDVSDEKKLQQGLKFLHAVDINHVNQKYLETKHVGNLEFASSTEKKWLPVRTLSHLAAVAIFLVAASLTIFYIATRQNNISSQDILPGSRKAVLVLEDDSRINLHEIADGTIIVEGGTSIEKTTDKLVYPSFSGAQHSVKFNTIATPPGGTYSFTLSDGTNIWLNAASSIRFPAVFSGNQRKVTITGEVYFEVAALSLSLFRKGDPGNSGTETTARNFNRRKGDKMPFVVEIKDRNVNIEVLGTHFNVNAYGDHDNTKITLLEGEINVIRENEQPARLKPDQEATLPVLGKTMLISKADTATAIAWKNGSFRFDNNASVETIMKQVGRWYDVQVEYRGQIPDKKLKGSIGRNKKLSEIIEVFSLNGVDCKIQGRKIIVKGKK